MPASASNEAQRLLAAFGTAEGIPVFITGTRDPQDARFFPGLREAMTGAAAYRLAEDLDDDVPEKKELMEIAVRLQQTGARKILGQGGQTPGTSAKRKRRK